MQVLEIDSLKIAVIGLGYVGLPLAVEFGKKIPTFGFDINETRIKELSQAIDSTLEVSAEELKAASFFSATNDLEAIRDCNVYIVTVPTPIDAYNNPDLTPLIKASETVGAVISQGDIVIYESTVYPGATEEDCIPIIERVSALTFNQDFFAGYSPERINPGDKEHRVTNILKVTSGSTPAAADFVDQLYQQIIVAGTYKTETIREAEAAKVIENTQRDINIALINELAIIFNKLGINTENVLKAAGTKWNFLPFRPGLVGGHCIGVDPYYLTHKAQSIGYHPEVISAGRRINDGMGNYIVSQVTQLMLKRKVHVFESNILIMGLAFKENCPDIRNTRVVDIVDELKSYDANIDIYDPWVDAADAEHEYGLSLIEQPKAKFYDAIIVAVGHKEFLEMGASQIRGFGKDACVLFDVKYLFDAEDVDGRL